jgi:hypothetical protein
MLVYLVIPLQADNAPLERAIEARSDVLMDRYRLQDNRGWLIRFNGTSKELSDTIGITSQSGAPSSSVGSALVVPIAGYYGMGPVDMWEWLKTRFEL